MLCPFCGSDAVFSKHYGRKVGGTLGALAGAAGGATEAMVGARLGAVVGSFVGPVGSLAGATLGGQPALPGRFRNIKSSSDISRFKIVSDTYHPSERVISHWFMS